MSSPAVPARRDPLFAGPPPAPAFVRRKQLGWWGDLSELRNFFLDCEVVPFLGKTNGPFVFFAILFKTCHEINLMRFLSLPSKMDNTTAE